MKRKVYFFDNQERVIQKVDDLKNNGYAENDMYVLARGEHNSDNIRGKREKVVESIEPKARSMWESIQDLAGVSSDSLDIFHHLGFTEGEMEPLQEILNSGHLVLVVME